MSTNKITPGIWFTSVDGTLLTIVNYYKEIFGNDFEMNQIIPLGETPSGNAEICEVQLFGQTFSFLSTADEHHLLNDAVSFIIHCENQTEIDKFWDYFTAEGEESQCGWCIDKNGLRWQVIPNNLSELMNMPNAGEVLMSQRRIVIEEYLKK